MNAPRIIDTHMHGRPGITGVFLLEGEQTALIESGPKSSVNNVLAGLEELGVDQLDWIIVTHIHLDHAGGAGTLAQRFPNAKVAVHEVGAPHLIDPAKLWSSASRIYGDQMEQLWGGIDPIPEERIHVLRDEDTIDLGGRTVTAFDTPGHAGHHHVYLDDATGIVFTGDALGVRLQSPCVVRPATPPPEFNLEVAIQSIERLRGLGASSFWLTHYGPCDTGDRPLSVDEACTAAISALRTWADMISEARTESDDIDEITERVKTRVAEALADVATPEEMDRMEQTTSFRMNTSGYMRYFDKKEAAASS